MKNRYVGDLGDFGKYTLLKTLCGPESDRVPSLRLGIVWYLTRDDPSRKDGKFTD